MESLSVEIIRMLQVMKEKGMTQKELCNRIGRDQNTFTQWKRGNNKGYRSYISEIAEILGVSADYLLGKTDDPRPILERAGINPIPMEEQAMRPIIGMASAGSGVLAQEQILGWESVDIK